MATMGATLFSFEVRGYLRILDISLALRVSVVQIHLVDAATREVYFR